MPLEPAIAAMLDLLNSRGAAQLSAGSPEQARAGFRLLTVDLRDPAHLAPVRSVDNRTIPGPGGELRVRIHRPERDGELPTILFFHGGGFVIGDLDTHEDHTRALCANVGAVVVSVDYRLAPEHPFPAAYEDCLAAFQWVIEHIGELGGDRERVAVAGDSAGGNLAAAVALAARDLKLPLAAQLLIYPAVDFVEDADYPSRVENGEGLFLTANDMRWFGDHYVPDVQLRTDPRASVLRAPDLSGLPPAIVTTAEYDPLRDEGEAYARALKQAGVDVDLRRYDGLIHGFFGLPHVSPASAAAVQELCDALRALLEARERKAA